MLYRLMTNSTEKRLNYKGSELNLTYEDGAFFSKHPDNSWPKIFYDPCSTICLHRYGQWRHYHLTGPVNLYTGDKLSMRIKPGIGALYAAHTPLKVYGFIRPIQALHFPHSDSSGTANPAQAA